MSFSDKMRLIKF